MQITLIMTRKCFYNQMLFLHGGSCLYEALQVSYIDFNSQMLSLVVHDIDDDNMMCIFYSPRNDLGASCKCFLCMMFPVGMKLCIFHSPRNDIKMK